MTHNLDLAFLRCIELRAEESVHAHFPAHVIRVVRHIAGGKIVQNIACGNEGGGTGEPPCIIGFDESQSDFVGGAYADPRSRPHTRARRLVEFFGSVGGVFNAPLTELEAAGLPAQAAQSICTGRSIELAHDELAKAGASGIQIVAMDDAEYPSRLRPIYDPPVVLYVRGNIAAVSQPGIAVVGTRHPTPYGMGMAERLGCDLAARGLAIISGLARGVDTFAHRGALSAKGKAVAVFGTGVDAIYPKENSRLADQILSMGGALISGISFSHIRRAAELPDPQSNHQWNVFRRAGGGSRGIQRHTYYRALRTGAES